MLAVHQVRAKSQFLDAGEDVEDYPCYFGDALVLPF